jgi:class 3 adenylate cyclase/pimeloyl-ACP methyl ester carboxylesterase
MDPPPTQYVDREGAALAYQVVGGGPVEFVHFFEVSQHLDLMWTDPDIHHNFEHVSRAARNVIFQRRGVGLSDQVPYVPTIEQQADDVIAIMDAVGMRRATLIAWYTASGPMALVAARTPERVDNLVLIDPLAQGPEASGQLHGWTHAEAVTAAESLRDVRDRWGSGALIDLFDLAMGTAFNRRLMALLERSSMTPTAARANWEMIARQDIQDVLRSVRVPTLVVRSFVTAWPEAAVRYAAELIPSSKYHVLPPPLPGTSLGKATAPINDLWEEMATGTPPAASADRFLGTVLFTDVVSSTELLAKVGDSTYRQLRADHERQVRLAVERNGGDLMTVAGDGTLSVFDGPSAAVRCAELVSREAKESGLAVRAGVHTGELERDGMNVTGLTVHIGARVGAAAGAGEVLVSRTVRDLAVGSGLMFSSRGKQDLKGVPGRWELFAVTHAGDQPEDLPLEESMQTPMDKMVLQAARTAPGFVRAAVRLGNAVERRRAKARRP